MRKGEHVREKLTQEQVLDLMRNGWSCIYSHSMSRFSDGYWMLQQGKSGHGGATKQPHGQTMKALVRKKLIKALPYKTASFHTEFVLAEPSSPSRERGLTT
jgi:hypothetical protein